MVCMVVSDDQPIDIGEFGGKQLLAKIGPAIDQQMLAPTLDDDRGSGATVLRLAGIAVAPVVAYPRNSG